MTKENNNNNQKALYEKEILSLIKLIDWDWFAKDIDRNIILTYPVYNNAFTIVEYLLENKKYNIEQYHPEISHSLQSCIMLTGEKMQDYLLSKNIHSEYITDMAFKAYTRSDYVMSEYKIDYMNKAQKLIHLNTNFSKLLINFITDTEFEKMRDTFYRFLEEHPTPLQDKIKCISTILTKLEEKKSGARFASKYRDLGKWLHYHQLNDKFVPKEITGAKKTKI